MVGDPGRLRQILVDLVGNAIKFTGRGEVVAGEAEEFRMERRAVLHFSVKDTGIGIPARKQEEISNLTKPLGHRELKETIHSVLARVSYPR